METGPRTNTEWDLDYDLKAGRINNSMALVNYHTGFHNRWRRCFPARAR